VSISDNRSFVVVCVQLHFLPLALYLTINHYVHYPSQKKMKYNLLVYLTICINCYIMDVTIYRNTESCTIFLEIENGEMSEDRLFEKFGRSILPTWILQTFIQKYVYRHSLIRRMG